VTYTAKIDWFGTVRGRIGYVWGNGDVLSYVTGGLAYSKVELDDGVLGGLISGLLPFTLGQGIGHSQINTGWTVGSGIEGKLLIPGWTLKAEYLYVDLGTLDTTGAGVSFGNCPGCNGLLPGPEGKSPRTAISPTTSFALG
jgi:outer membrane immunogenic protein